MRLERAGGIIGGVAVGKIINLLADYLDSKLGKTGEVIYKKPSTFVNAGSGIGLIVAGVTNKVPPHLEEFVVSAGASALVGLVENIAKPTVVVPTTSPKPAKALVIPATVSKLEVA